MQALITSERGVTELGPPTYPLLRKTAEEMFDVEAHKPKDLIVQQVN